MGLVLLKYFDLKTLWAQLSNDDVLIEDYIRWNVDYYKSMVPDVVYAIAGWSFLLGLCYLAK